MFDMKKARCAECPEYLHYREKEPKRRHGTTVRPGCRYCLAWKRARLFKKKDPKMYLPKWCPRRITPPILRVYGQRDGLLHMHSVYMKGKELRWPDAKGYALRFQGRAIQTGRDFYIIIHNREKMHHVDTAEIAEELGVHINKYDVIEFDDGVKPMFYWHDYPRLRQIMFDRDLAEGYPPSEDKSNYD